MKDYTNQGHMYVSINFSISQARIHPNIGFWKQLQNVEKKIHNGNTTINIRPGKNKLDAHDSMGYLVVDFVPSLAAKL